MLTLTPLLVLPTVELVHTTRRMMSGPRRVAFGIAYALLLGYWHVLLSGFFAVQAEPPTSLRQQPVPAVRLSPPPPPPSTSLLPPPPSPPPPPPPSTPPVRAAVESPPTLAQCTGHVHTEYDGAVMVPGSGPGATVSTSVAECCALCSKTRGCNVWVACTNPWCGNQCWLKWAEDPSKPTVRAQGGTTPWTSGTIQKDVPGDQPVPPEAKLNATRVVALRTSAGDLRIRLKPEWHLPSARFVQKAALGDFCTVKCELYRAEPGFLLQGALRALVQPNKACRYFRGGPAECTDPEVAPRLAPPAARPSPQRGPGSHADTGTASAAPLARRSDQAATSWRRATWRGLAGRPGPTSSS